MMSKKLMIILMLCFSVNCFAANSFLDELSESDQEKIKAHCEAKKSTPSLTVRQYAKERMALMKDLHEKYPSVELANPCAT